MSRDTWTISMLGVHVTLDELPTLLADKVTITPAKKVQVPVYSRYTGKQAGIETVIQDPVLTFHHADGAEDHEGSWSQYREIEDQLGRLLGLEVSAHIVDEEVVGYALGWGVEDSSLDELTAAIEKARKYGPILGKTPRMLSLECSQG